MVRVIESVRNPLETTMKLAGYLDSTILWQKYGKLAKEKGFQKLYLVLSFDCDTVEDAHVVSAIDRRLRDMGVKPMYAVPGEVLEREITVYRGLFERGAEFLNHGYTMHTFWNSAKGRFQSCFFYHELSPGVIEDDILRGHAAVEKVLGKKPAGFRTPHFGTFQSGRNLGFLHGVLAKMGYKYSSSTMPYYGYRFGPVFRRFGLAEFPVTGVFSRPLAVQDSWSFFAAPQRRWGAKDFLDQTTKVSAFFDKNGLTGIINIYADPLHVKEEPRFFEAMEVLKRVAEPVQLGELASGAMKYTR